MTTIRLLPLSEAALPALTDVAVADSVPSEVMPPVDGPGEDWTAARVAGFGDFQRTRLAAPDRASYLITVDDAPAGVIRLDPLPDGTRVLGYWVARSHRRKGVASQAVELALIEAKALGATTVVAKTTLDNHGSRGVLARNGAEFTVDGDAVEAAFRL